MAGTFSLTAPRDLLAKLRREYERLHNAPGDVDHAFNFFVTAEHMLDWLYPGQDNSARSMREAQRSSDPLLETAANLANGAKHFDKLGPKNKSVSATSRGGGYFSSNYFADAFFPRNFFAKPSLVVHLTGSASSSLGSSIAAVELARLVLAYWETPGRVP